MSLLFLFLIIFQLFVLHFVLYTYKHYAMCFDWTRVKNCCPLHLLWYETRLHMTMKFIESIVYVQIWRIIFCRPVGLQIYVEIWRIIFCRPLVLQIYYYKTIYQYKRRTKRRIFKSSHSPKKFHFSGFTITIICKTRYLCGGSR